MNVNGDNIDWKAREVMAAIIENDGEATTSEIKEYTGLDSNQIILYRLEKLEKARLIDTKKVQNWDKDIPAPTLALATKKGEMIYNEFDFAVEVSDDDLSLDDRLERVEKMLEKQRETYTLVKRRIVEIEDRLDDDEEDIDDLASDIRNIQDFLSERFE